MTNKEKYQLLKLAGLPSEFAGSTLSPLIGMTAGGIAGELGGLSNNETGMAMQAGMVLPKLIAMIAAGASPTRTRKEQMYAEGEGGMNFIPGVGDYNLYKRLGHSAWGEGSPGEEEEAKRYKSLSKKYA